MTSHFPVGIQQPPQQLQAAQGLGTPGSLHHGLPSNVNHSEWQPMEVSPATTAGATTIAEEDHKRAVESSIKVKSEPNTSDDQSSVLNYTEIAPFPPRPLVNRFLRRPPADATFLTKSSNTSSSNNVGDRGQALETPVVARVYPQGNVADLSPWRGKQLEDNLSEQTIKSGFQNKPLITNESNTARPSLWSHLKNKGGPQTLSSLFVNLLEKRQATGRVTGASTFRPPPRLAMSNARREGFFRELSDPSWPMRKLNRSVPHTISGKVLLDQCLSKNIPIPRAVWLSKCIGANDIRALKRKSTSVTTTMGGEAKYIKDWTVHVEQFVKGIVLSVGEPDWKNKTDYAIRLVSHLFSEHLLDEEHYLDWLLSAFESCTIQHLPIWLVLIQIYWTPLTVNRRRGSRLAESLLNHLEQLSAEESEDILQPAISRIESLLTVLAVHHNGCLILPRSWSRFRQLILSTATATASPEAQASFANITFRNDRLVGSLGSNSNGKSSRKSQIIDILDSIALDLPISNLAEKCLQLEPNFSSLIDIILSWSSSVYRHGEYRIFLAARLLKKLRQQKDVDEMIWEILQDLCQDPGIIKTNLFRVVVELVRAKQFSVGRFVQHLISIGAPYSSNIRHHSLLELLDNIPDRGLTAGISSMRTDLLDSAVLSSGSTRKACQELEDDVMDSLSSESNEQLLYQSKAKIYARKVESLSQAFNLGHHIRNHFLPIIQKVIGAGSDYWSKPGTVKCFQGAFFFARTFLEDLQQYPCLVDILGMSLEFDNQAILTDVVHTIHYGHKCYIGMGAMKSLFDKLVACYETIRNHQPLIRSFCSAMLELSTTLDASKSLISQLTQDVLRSDQLSAAAICSPASDNADMMQLSTMDFEDEMERVLSSGTTMDGRILTRVFDRIFNKIQETYKQPMADAFPFSAWLARLRSFDTTSFDGMIRRCISTLLSSSDGCDLLNSFFLPIVIGGSCMSLAEYVTFVQNTHRGKSHMHSSVASRLELLKVLVPKTDEDVRCIPQDAYKFKLEQQMFIRNFSGLIVTLLQGIISAGHDDSETSSIAIDDSEILTPDLIHFLTGTLATSAERRSEFADMLRTLNERSMRQACRLVDSLLDPTQKLDLINASVAEKPARIITFINELSAPFCTLALDAFQCEMAAQKTSAIDAAKSNELAILLLQSIIAAASDEDNMGFSVLSGLHVEIRRQLFQVAEDHILNSAADGSNSIRAIKSYLTVAERTSSSLTTDTDFSIPSNIIDKYKAIMNSLASELNGNQADHAMDGDAPTDAALLEQSITTLSFLLIIRRRACGFQKFPPHDNMALFSLLSTLILYPQLQPLTDTTDFVFDVLAMLADDFTDEQRAFMTKSDIWRPSDARLNFLQGPTGSSSLDTWLGLVLTQQPPPSNSGSSSAPSSQGTPAAPRTPISHPASHPSPRPPGSQPSRGQPQQQTQQSSMRGSAAQGGNAQKIVQPPVQFPLKHWEQIWDQGSAGAANDTAISLGLFGMRKA